MARRRWGRILGVTVILLLVLSGAGNHSDDRLETDHRTAGARR